MAESLYSIVEEREELMVSPSGDGTPILRTAHFLKPSVTSTDEQIIQLSSPSHFVASTFEQKNVPLKVHFSGWTNPSEIWTQWINHMQPTHQSTWKKAGIYDAIMNSTIEIRRNNEILLGIAEKWSPETNTFIFPWGEATITLEDIMILGGYSVFGDSVLSAVETRDLKQIEGKLMQARVEAGRSKSKKATQMVWLKMFMDTGSEIEHEAFLVMWLSRFVFAESKLIRKLVFPIAIRLAKATRIALAQSVLASIYKDLSFWKIKIDSTKLDNGGNREELNLWSPFELVQIWVWERFRSLQPLPHSIGHGHPVFARWDRVKSRKLDNIGSALDSAGKRFQWRPYAMAVNDWVPPKYYAEEEQWVIVDQNLDDEESHSFAVCVRAAKLVGLGFTEDYFPHRVAMQFGLDQDLPGSDIAWNDFSRQLKGLNLYIPSRNFRAGVTARYSEWWKRSSAGVTARYSEWWKRSSSGLHGTTKGSERMEGTQTKELFKSKGENRENDSSVTLSFKPVSNEVKEEKCVGNNADVPPGFPPKQSQARASESSVKDHGAVRGESSENLAENSVLNSEPLIMDNESVRPAVTQTYTKPNTDRNEDRNEGRASSYAPELPGLELESRIRKLETIVVELKTAKFSRRS